MHVLGQKETLCQTLCNLPTFTLGPSPDVGRHRKGLIAELEGSLPAHFRLGGRRHIRPDKGSWPSATGKFSNNDLTRGPG